MARPEQLPLFDLEPPAEAFCPHCGTKLKRLADGRRVHRPGDGRRCDEIYTSRIIGLLRRSKSSCLPLSLSIHPQRDPVKQRDEEEASSSSALGGAAA